MTCAAGPDFGPFAPSGHSIATPHFKPVLSSQFGSVPMWRVPATGCIKKYTGPVAVNVLLDSEDVVPRRIYVKSCPVLRERVV